jgi:hypothetical protein
MATSASKIVFHIKPSSSLADLNAEVNQGESGYGTLSDIGNDGSETLLTFTTSGVPDTIATISLQTAGVPNIPAGSTQVATGTIFVLGQLVLAVAVRG